MANFSIPNKLSFWMSSNTQKSQFGSRFFSFVTDDEFFPKWNACRVDGQTQMTLLQRKLMTIFSPPPTIHLVVVTSLPFGFALTSRRGVNQTFFCENNQNSIKHLCIQNTKFLCIENTIQEQNRENKNMLIQYQQSHYSFCCSQNIS